MKKLILILAMVFAPLAVQSAEFVFSGLPEKKIEINGGDQGKPPSVGVLESINETDGQKAIFIVKFDPESKEPAVWITRGGQPMAVRKNGDYMTFISVVGGGYINIVGCKEVKDGQVQNDLKPMATCVYVEHICTGLSSTTYFGAAVMYVHIVVQKPSEVFKL